MIGALLLSLALAADRPAPLTGVISKSYGHWVVDCNLGSPGPDGRIGCDASTSADSIDISVSRKGDEIQYFLRSEKCPGLIADGKLAPGAFTKQGAPQLGAMDGYDRIAAAALSFKAVCGIAGSSIDLDRVNMELAFRHLLKRDTPAEITDAARKGIW